MFAMRTCSLCGSTPPTYVPRHPAPAGRARTLARGQGLPAASTGRATRSLRRRRPPRLGLPQSRPSTRFPERPRRCTHVSSCCCPVSRPPNTGIRKTPCGLYSADEGAYTTVNGGKVYMGRGDFIVTPAWTWHGHRNETGSEMIWVDGLDSLLIKAVRRHLLRALRPAIAVLITSEQPTPVDYMSGQPPGAGWTTRAVPATWIHQAGTGFDTSIRKPVAIHCRPLPRFSVICPPPSRGLRTRSSDSVVFVVVSGKGRTLLESTTIEWSENDMFTIPTWQRYQHACSGDAVLFSFSDRAAQERTRDAGGNSAVSRVLTTSVPGSPRNCPRHGAGEGEAVVFLHGPRKYQRESVRSTPPHGEDASCHRVGCSRLRPRAITTKANSSLRATLCRILRVRSIYVGAELRAPCWLLHPMGGTHRATLSFSCIPIVFPVSFSPIRFRAADHLAKIWSPVFWRRGFSLFSTGSRPRTSLPRGAASFARAGCFG